jgi:hypothetical protein
LSRKIFGPKLKSLTQLRKDECAIIHHSKLKPQVHACQVSLSSAAGSNWMGTYDKNKRFLGWAVNYKLKFRNMQKQVLLKLLQKMTT